MNSTFISIRLLIALSKRSYGNRTPPLHHFTHLDLSTKCIRLLYLSSRFPTGEVCARLHTFPLTECPPYIALSYTWRPRYPLQHISLNGQNIKVGRNFFDALHVVSGGIDSDINTWHVFIEQPRISNDIIKPLEWRSTPDIYEKPVVLETLLGRRALRLFRSIQNKSPHKTEIITSSFCVWFGVFSVRYRRKLHYRLKCQYLVFCMNLTSRSHLALPVLYGCIKGGWEEA